MARTNRIFSLISLYQNKLTIFRFESSRLKRTAQCQLKAKILSSNNECLGAACNKLKTWPNTSYKVEMWTLKLSRY